MVHCIHYIETMEMWNITYLILEGYFLQNRIIFDSVDKLSPVSNMAYSSEIKYI